MPVYEPGQVLEDRYRIVKVLSRGGMGMVYHAQQISLGRDVAIKVMLQKEGKGPDLLRRFEVEAQAVCRLSHPNTIVYYDYGVDLNKRPYLVMEYVKGKSGDKFLKENSDWEVQDLVHIFSQLSSALEEAHDIGIIHRDIKWSNVIICPESHDPYFTKLIDFGVLKRIGGDEETLNAITKTGMMIGTPDYMSPELICGAIIDGRTDQYAVGIMLYEALEGHRPFWAPSPFEIMRMHVQEEVPRMVRGQAILKRYPLLEGVILKALSKVPQQRFEDMGAFRRALLASLKEPQDSRGTNPYKKTRQTLRKISEQAVLLEKSDKETLIVPKVTEDMVKHHRAKSRRSEELQSPVVAAAYDEWQANTTTPNPKPAFYEVPREVLAKQQPRLLQKHSLYLVLITFFATLSSLLLFRHLGLEIGDKDPSELSSTSAEALAAERSKVGEESEDAPLALSLAHSGDEAKAEASKEGLWGEYGAKKALNGKASQEVASDETLAAEGKRQAQIPEAGDPRQDVRDEAAKAKAFGGPSGEQEKGRMEAGDEPGKAASPDGVSRPQLANKAPQRAEKPELQKEGRESTKGARESTKGGRESTKGGPPKAEAAKATKKPEAKVEDDKASPLPKKVSHLASKEPSDEGLAKQAVAGKGTLTVLSIPWSEVYIDGKHAGTSPFKIELDEGTYRIGLKQDRGFKGMHEVSLKVTSNGRTHYKVRLDEVLEATSEAPETF